MQRIPQLRGHQILQAYDMVFAPWPILGPHHGWLRAKAPVPKRQPGPFVAVSTLELIALFALHFTSADSHLQRLRRSVSVPMKDAAPCLPPESSLGPRVNSSPPEGGALICAGRPIPNRATAGRGLQSSRLRLPKTRAVRWKAPLPLYRRVWWAVRSHRARADSPGTSPDVCRNYSRPIEALTEVKLVR